jgi:hypothetical protein
MTETTARLTDAEARQWLVRAMPTLLLMAEEGVSMEGCEDPQDMLSELADRLGVGDEDECWNAAVLRLVQGEAT